MTALLPQEQLHIMTVYTICRHLVTVHECMPTLPLLFTWQCLISSLIKLVWHNMLSGRIIIMQLHYKVCNKLTTHNHAQQNKINNLYVQPKTTSLQLESSEQCKWKELHVAKKGIASFGRLTLTKAISTPSFSSVSVKHQQIQYPLSSL